jgi:hypothetical protein
MKRTFAVVTLLAALGVLIKLASKGEPSPAGVGPEGVSAARERPRDPRAEILARYPDDPDLVRRVLDQFAHNAEAIEATDGLRGLLLLDRLGLEAVYLHERHPRDFRKLRDSLTDEAAAEVLLHWREYFGLKATDDTDREILIDEIARLSPSARRVARRHPNMLPLLLAEPAGVTELIDRYQDDPEDLRDALVALTLISLEPGSTDLRAALRVLDEFGPLALRAFRLQGPDGLALVQLYGPVLLALGDTLPLDQALILLRVNAEDLDRMLETRRPETLALALRHVAAGGQAMIGAVGSSPHGLRMTVEFGAQGDRALLRAGPDAADVLYGLYAGADPTLKSQVVAALAEHDAMALALLSKYAGDSDFRDVLRAHGPAVIPPIARADRGPEVLTLLRDKPNRTAVETVALGLSYLDRESGQGMIQRIKADGLDRIEDLESTEVAAYQFLPLYDLIHLGGVLTRGHAPTQGELAWAVVDGCFVVVDVLSLLALQPEGVAASELARTELKAAAREGAKAVVQNLTEEATEAAARQALREGAAEGLEIAAEQASKWWAVRQAGGPFQVLRRLPEALDRLELPRVVELAAPLTRRAGLRLSGWDKPLRFVTRAGETVMALPTDRGLKYVGAQALQASVGVVGYQKMEEYLRSRRSEDLSGGRDPLDE